MNKKDLRVVKTQNTLYTTLLELMKEKSFEEIKVSDICSHALINRSTFYAHYNDKYELLADAIDDLKNSLIMELNKNKSISNTKEYYLEMIRLFLNNIEEKKDIYLAVMINNRNSIIVYIIYDVLDHDVTNRLKESKDKNDNSVPINIAAKFYLGAVFNVGIEWLRNDSRYTKDDIINYLDLLIPDNLN